MWDYLLDCIPKQCCVGKSKRNQAFALARERLENETDIVQMIKSIRFFHTKLGYPRVVKGQKYHAARCENFKDDDTLICIDLDKMEIQELDQELM